jgi:PKHD-type hydroxylase
MYILKILNDNDLKKARELIKKVEFLDGKNSAKGLAQEVKSNLEADPNHQHYKEAVEFINHKFRQNVQVKNLFLPHSFSSPIINKYSKGDKYGRHFDASHMFTSNGTYKSDFSFTLMLSSLDEYEGGELLIESELVSREFRIASGDAVIYSSNNIHQVTPVTKGERLAYVGWLTSSFKNYAAFEAMKEFEAMHVDLLKGDLSDDTKLKIAFVKNKLRYVLSK